MDTACSWAESVTVVMVVDVLVGLRAVLLRCVVLVAAVKSCYHWR